MPSGLAFGTAMVVGGTVNATVVQPDGKIIIGGYFSQVKDLDGTVVARQSIARFNAGER